MKAMTILFAAFILIFSFPSPCGEMNDERVIEYHDRVYCSSEVSIPLRGDER